MGEDSKHKILVAAKRLFIDRGFSATTMRDISSAANINKGLLHYYFQSKQTLFVNVLQMTTLELLPKIDAIVHLSVSFEEKIELIVDEYIEFLLINPRLPAFIINEVSANAELFMKTIMESEIYSKISNIAETIIKESTLVNSKMDPINFVFNLLSLLLYPFLMKPVIQKIGSIDDENFNYMMRLRKKIVVDTLINSIKR